MQLESYEFVVVRVEKWAEVGNSDRRLILILAIQIINNRFKVYFKFQSNVS